MLAFGEAATVKFNKDFRGEFGPKSNLLRDDSIPIAMHNCF